MGSISRVTRVASLLLAVVIGLAAGAVAHAQQLGSEGIGCRAQLFHVAAPGANVDFVTVDPKGNTVTGFTAGSANSVFRVQVNLAVAGKFKLRAKDGTTTRTSYLNGGVDLAANTTYTFEFLGSNVKPRQDQNATPTAIEWNFQIETNGEINEFGLHEVAAPGI